MSRAVRARYVDPLDQIWLAAAARLGLQVRRDPGAYASTDGRGALSIAPPEEMDADDCLAQIIFHELCHALVQGESSFQQPDWGLVNDERSAAYGGDTLREQACLRVQAALAHKHGLRELLAPTTDFRAFYDRLGADPLAPLGDDGGASDAAIPLARAGLGRSARAPMAAVLSEALQRTAAVHEALRGCALEVPGPLPSLFALAPAPPRHATGFPMNQDQALTCGTCAWRSGGRCQQAGESAAGRVSEAALACALHEAPPSCLECGACCRHAYDTVLLSAREPLRRLRPDLVAQTGGVWQLRRSSDGSRCAALAGAAEGPFHCEVYSDRPRTCRDFTRGSANCLQARRRVGLST